MSAEKLIDSIDALYFKDEEEFNLDYLTDRLPSNLTSEYLLDYKNQLETLLHVVSRKVSELILSHQPKYVEELQRIADLQKSLTESVSVCREGRSSLIFIRDGTAKNGRTIVDNYRKRKALSRQLESCTVINELRKSVLEIRDLIESQENFAKAIQKCKEGKALLEPYQNYKCVEELSLKLDFTIEHIIDQALTFFNAYHKSSMDELKMFLDNELWEILPVRNDFKLAQLKEFAFLRSESTASKFNSNQISTSGQQLNPTENNPPNTEQQDTDLNYFNTLEGGMPLKSLIPFEKFLNMNKDSCEDLFGVIDSPNSTASPSRYPRNPALPLDKISLSSDSDIDEEDDLNSELHKDFVEEDEFVSSEDDECKQKYSSSSKITNEKLSASSPSMKQKPSTLTGTLTERHYPVPKFSGPALTNSSLNVLRLFGKYIQMMNVLEPISYEILMKIYSLLDYYTLTVYREFGPDSDKKTDDKNVSPKLRVVIKSIRGSLLGNSSQSSAMDNPSSTNSGPTCLNVDQAVPNISDIITQDLVAGQSSGSYDAPVDPKKYVAIESLVFLVNQLWNLQEYLESLIPSDLRPRLRSQFTQKQSMVPDFLKARAD